MEEFNPAETLLAWEKITGKPAIPPPLYLERFDGSINAENVQQWKLRKCDREDTDDWIPYHIANWVYYLNVNPASSAYTNFLAMRLMVGKSPVPIIFIDEYANDRLVSSTEAKAEKDRGERPEDLDNVMAELTKITGKK